MFISEVCKECSLTKKAVMYYEKQGLVHPKIGDNGYRMYSSEDISILKEIAVLRTIGLSIPDIKNVIESPNKSLSLVKYRNLMNLEIEKRKTQKKYLERLISNYDIEKEKESIESNLNQAFTIKEKLVQAFPGYYGMYLSIHFGPFLNEKVDSPEKEEAYTQIVHFLDNLQLTEEVEKYIEDILPQMEGAEAEEISSSLKKTIENVDHYLVNNEKEIGKYIEYRTSEEFMTTPAFKMQQIFLEFQEKSGYYDIFIPKLKILSNSYREYSEKLQKANEQFLKSFPKAADFFTKKK